MNDVLIPILPSVKKKTLAMEVDSLLNVPAIYRNVLPYFLNGGKCGHKVMDVKGAVDALRDGDTEGKLLSYGVNDFKLGNTLKNVLRTRIHLNNNWKTDGVNPDVAAEFPEAAKQFEEFLIVLGYKPPVENDDE